MRHETFIRHRIAVKVLHYIRPAGDGGQGEPAADGLAQGAKVRRHAVIGLGTAIGESEAGHHLVKDQGDLVFGRQRPQGFQEPGLWRQRALERLDNNAAQFLVMFLDQAGRGLGIIERRDQDFLADALWNAR